MTACRWWAGWQTASTRAGALRGDHRRAEQKLPGPLVGELPYLPRAEQRELAQYIDLSALGGVLSVDRVVA
jgi:dethiobiotin synthetase